MKKAKIEKYVILIHKSAYDLQEKIIILLNDKYELIGSLIVVPDRRNDGSYLYVREMIKYK